MPGARLLLAVGFAEKYALMLLAMAGAMLMARLLTPHQVGVYSIAAVVAGMAHILRDFGVGQYLVAAREIGPQEQRAALTVSLACAGLLAAMLVVVSAPLSRFYREPELQPALRLLALNVLLLPPASQTLSLLRRSLRVGAIFAMNMTHGCAQLVITAWLALRGFGTLSLAGGALGASLAMLGAALLLRPAGMSWLPGWKGTRAVLSFGLASAGGNLIDEAGVAAPDLIVGRMQGAAEVAVLGKAQGLLSLFNQAVGSAVAPVIFPLFARQAREGADMRHAYLRTVSLMTAIAWPFFAFLAILPSPAIKMLYGYQWDAAAALIRIMCLPVALYSMFTMARHLLAALGQVRAQARLDASAVLLRVGLLLPAALLDLHWVALAVAAGMLFRIWLTWRLLSRLAGLTWRHLRAATARSALLAAWTSIAPLAAAIASGGDGNAGAQELAAAMACALLLWCLGLWRLHHPLGAELALVGRKLAARFGNS